MVLVLFHVYRTMDKLGIAVHLNLLVSSQLFPLLTLSRTS